MRNEVVQSIRVSTRLCSTVVREDRRIPKNPLNLVHPSIYLECQSSAFFDYWFSNAVNIAHSEALAVSLGSNVRIEIISPDERLGTKKDERINHCFSKEGEETLKGNWSV